MVGKTLAAAVMVLGYSIIAVPTGIVTAEIVEAAVAARGQTRACPECASGGHVDSARFCKDCGAHLRPSAEGEGEGSTPTFPGAGSG